MRHADTLTQPLSGDEPHTMLMNARGLMELIIPLLPVLLASLLVYIFGFRKWKKERIATEQIKIYASLMIYLQNLPDKLDNKSEENLTSLASEFNEIYNKMLLYSPDHIIEKTQSAFNKIKKGESVIPLMDLMITLRKEFIPNTNLKPEDIVSLEFRA